MNKLYRDSSGSPCVYKRRRSIEVPIGAVPLGGTNPIRLQSMASVSTLDTEAAVIQTGRIIEAGADYIRYTAQGRREAANLANIRSRVSALGYDTPLIADIHFNPSAADEALEHIEKVRINPGNYVDTKTATPREWTSQLFDEMHEKVRERFGVFVERAKDLGRTIRIGVNHGSLSERMVMLYGDTPEGMVQSCLEYLDVCRDHGFDRIVISMKSSNTLVMTAAVRLLVMRLEEGGYPAYPLHLGVTEAGEGEDGRIKSAVGIGSLLHDGIGDTIRVSLSEDPELEIPVGRALVEHIISKATLGSVLTLPSWQEYNELRHNARPHSKRIGRLVGADNLPIVIAEHQQQSLEVAADYYLGEDGYLYTQAGAKMQELQYRELDCLAIADEQLDELRANPKILILLHARGDGAVQLWRWGFCQIRRAGLNNPIILKRIYSESNVESFRLHAASDVGTILLDGWGNGLCLSATSLEAEDVNKTQLGILQATRLRMSKTEFISCPGCGRTLYNLQETIARVKAATSHLKGLKIGIMGCIVNGPGEMADADYGYVGAAPGKIDLYKGQTCVRKGIAEVEAVEQLIDLIKSEGDWRSPEDKE